MNRRDMERRVIRKIEAGFAHSCPMTSFTPLQKEALLRLGAVGIVRVLPPFGRFARRAVITVYGSRITETFVMDDPGFAS